MTTHTRTLLLAALLALSNLLWWAAYRSLDRAYMQEEGLRDEADSLLRMREMVPGLCVEWDSRGNLVSVKCEVIPAPAPNR
jgi:hypothetical protein